MEASLNDSNFVICRCRHCEENIEFDANELGEESSMMPCPHCGLETRICAPKEEDHPEHGELATPAQMDYLSRLGLTPPPPLPFEAARLMIQEAPSSAKATGKQMELIHALGADVGVEFSQAEADQIIARMLEKQGRLSDEDSALLPRQMQILRFWDRIDLALSSRIEVAQWLNQFYDEDPRRQFAWEQFETEYGDQWLDDPFWVPLGMCESYLKQT